MARVKGRDRDTTHQAMIRAAIATFGELGYGRTSLVRIAESAGVSPAALCQHFGSKRGIYEAATDAIYASLVAGAAQLDASLPLHEQVDRVFRLAEAYRQQVRFLLRRILEGGGIDGDVRTRHVAPLLDNLTKVVAKAYRVPPRRAREALVVLGHLAARFVTNSDEDNRVAFAVDSNAQARKRIVLVLTATATHLLGACAAASAPRRDPDGSRSSLGADS